MDRITEETKGNYYENLPSDSELNTTNKTTSTTTSIGIPFSCEINPFAKTFEGATAIGVLSELIPKLYRRIVRFRKTSNGIKKLNTLNDVINLAS